MRRLALGQEKRWRAYDGDEVVGDDAHVVSVYAETSKSF